MKNDEWCKKIEDEIVTLKSRINKLEGIPSCSEQSLPEAIKLSIEWPEAEIGGICFDALKRQAVFDRKEDGNYYSRAILFNSARDTDKGTGRDLLSEYLDSEDVKKAFAAALENAGINTEGKEINVSIPQENQGVKKYNGVDWWYWLKSHASSSSSFCSVDYFGGSGTSGASAVGGVAPRFCVGDNRHK
jgi:hypothetical protein